MIKMEKRTIGLFFILTAIMIIGRYVMVTKGIQLFPNFEIITVLTFLAVMLLDERIAIIVPVTGMIVSDILIGNPVYTGAEINKIVIFTYSGFAILVLINTFAKKKIEPYFTSISKCSVISILGIGVSFVLIYDVWTNIGWWYLFYPHTLQGLATVFALGLPFMVYHLASGITTFLFIGLPVMTTVRSESSVSDKISYKVPALITIVLIVFSFV